MKTLRILLFTALASLSMAFADDSFFERSEHIVCDKGELRLARVPRKIFDEDFRGTSGLWESFDNYEGKLSLEYGGSMKIKLLPGKSGDTAFGLNSRKMSVKSGSMFRLNISACGTVDMSFAKPFGGKYRNVLLWFDANDENIGEFEFSFKSQSEAPIENVFQGIVPQKAVSAVLCIGADNPNIPSGKELEFTRISLESEDDTCRIWPVGTMVSRPFLYPSSGVITWDADTPGGSSIAVQFSTAADAGGVPGAWTPFAGPEWDVNRAFLKSGTALPKFPPKQLWMRYKVSFKAGKKKGPVLKSINIGELRDGNWTGADDQPPMIMRTSPALVQDAAAPVTFHVGDNTFVDWRTLEMKLDGKDITTSVVRQGNDLTYTPAKPFEPQSTGFSDISSWQRSNYHDMLKLELLQKDEDFLRATRDDGDTDTMFEFKSPDVTVKPGGKGTFSMEVRHNLQLMPAGHPKDAAARIIWLDAKGATIGQPVPLFVPKAEGWTAVEVTGDVPLDAVRARVTVGFDHPNIFDGRFFDIRRPKWSGDSGAPLPLAPNLHCFKIKVSDYSGNISQKDLYLLIDKPPVSNITTLRDDGCVLVDGKPFFPIGMYAVCRREFNGNNIYRACEKLSRAGFNTVHTYTIGRGSEYDEFLDAVAKYNLKLFVCSAVGTNTTDKAKVLSDVVREYRHPSMLAWYLGDDTSAWIRAKELAAVSETVKDVDTAHITVQADSVGPVDKSNYEDFVNSTDGFLPEIYPLRKGVSADETVPMVIRDMLKCKEDIAKHATSPKTIWPIIQAFDGWGWPRYPTYQELRAMTYASLVHGANGITWYTYGGFKDNHGVTSTPDRWANICRLATEINAIQQAFTSQEDIKANVKVVSGPEKDKLGYPSISMLARRVGNKQYLICVNSSMDDVIAKFSLPNAADLAEAKFENRNLPVRKGEFTDAFAAYAVHVYELKGIFD